MRLRLAAQIAPRQPGLLMRMAQAEAAAAHLSEAWQRLYHSLDARQKLRLRVFLGYSLREMKGAFESHMQAKTEEDDED